MFEVTGEDIARLRPGELRELVARLARAELRSTGHPTAGVTAGGHENAADGGIDVRVSCGVETLKLDFVPRPESGFQVKQTNMPPNEIKKEMRPAGVLRPAIGALADMGGAYIIVSGKESTADSALTEREQAMRDALHGHPASVLLKTEFYDRERLANWANVYFGIAAWIRARVGRPLTGWRSMDDATTTGQAPFLYDDVACLTDGCTPPISVSAGIERLRKVLCLPGKSVRLIGLSGVGKTRLVQALFELNVADAALDSAIGAYADEGEGPTPSAHEMARWLIATRTRAILIIDNCNPETHRQLTEITGASDSLVSLLTVEYDVRDDLPERTQVFRLEAASPDLLMHSLQADFPTVCQADYERIAAFAGGNFRIARAIAGSIGAGETIGHLRDQQLIDRIVQQRNPYDAGLLRAAEDLSLLYSVDGENTVSDSELALVGSLRGVSADALYAYVVTLRQRGIVQVRGRWRAVLPQAIANALASYGLERLPSATLDRFAAGLPERMQRSLTRRIGYLHDSRASAETVTRWLAETGPFGDLCVPDIEKATILANLAPVIPRLALERIGRALAGPQAAALLSPLAPTRNEWVRLIKLLAYDANLFEPAADLLAQFFAAEEMETHHNSDIGAFGELFLLHLSGTRAPPAQRRALVCRLAESGNAKAQSLATLALAGLLTTHQSASYLLDFGARSRDYGWAPADERDVDEWYAEAIDLAVRLSLVIPQTRRLLADSFRYLWGRASCRDAFARAANALARQSAWAEGWLAARAMLRDEATMPAEFREPLIEIIQQMKPTDPLDFARAVLLRSRPGGRDFADGEPGSDDMTVRWRHAGQIAQEIGRMMAQDDDRRGQFLPELLSQGDSTHPHEFGQGLAQATADLCETWAELLGHLRQVARYQRAGGALGGFLLEGRDRDPSFVRTALDQIASDAVLAHMLPSLQVLAGLDDEGVERVFRVIATGTVALCDFNELYFAQTPIRPETLATLLGEIAELPDGVPACVGILHSRFVQDAQLDDGISPLLIAVGCNLLRRVTITRRGLRDFALQDIVERCSAGPAGAEIARALGVRLREAVLTHGLFPSDLVGTFGALVITQTAAVLDVFVPAEPTWQDERVLHRGFGWGATLDRIDPLRVRDWADQEPAERYGRLGRLISMFTSALGGKPQELSPIFMTLLESAPDRVGFLGDYRKRVHPGGWSGSLANTLEQRRTLLLTLQQSPHPEVRQWVTDLRPDIDLAIENARHDELERERRREESFE